MTLNYDLELVRKKCDELREIIFSLSSPDDIPQKLAERLVAIRPVAAKLAEAIAEYQEGTK